MVLALGPEATAAGYRLAAFETIGSTNAEALARGRAGDPGRLWVASLAQTAGRGRRGRAWSTDPGNLAASLLVVTRLPAEQAAGLGFVAGIALGDALAAVAPSLAVAVALDGATGASRARFTLKWPNDVVADGAKLAGILLEAERLPDGASAVVVGIGVNVARVPAGLPYPATALAALGATASADALFAGLTDAWVAAAALWDDGRGFAAVRRRWLERAAGLGGPVAVRLGGDVVSGIFETIDEAGRLVVLAADGARRTVTAGEVHFGVAASAAR
jgi:BirA family biotin operon repressor/biotin-[acetyl-CoA-carboxylase] ligase